ncbi:MAG TPA: hypothetical protein VHJ82_01490 [Actinomycetota bacterium]|nr:hypothetical protein [Actinomycetota bacterium]
MSLVAIALALPGVMWLLTPAPRSQGTVAKHPHVATEPLPPNPDPSPTGNSVRSAPSFSPGTQAPQPDGETYALALPSLRGLPSDTPPGTPLKLWAAWEPPITKQPRIQVLIERVVLRAIVPPTDPGAPPTALLWVPVERIPDLLYGDRYGALSVTVPEQS